MAWWVVVTSVIVGVATLLYCQRSGMQDVLPSNFRSWLVSHLADDLAIVSSANLVANTERQWNIFYHMGGNSPWIPKLRDTENGGIKPPAGCHVDQVHMVGFNSSSKR